MDFWDGSARDGASGKTRIVPIFKQPPKPDQDLPRELAEIHHHEFYEYYDRDRLPVRAAFASYAPAVAPRRPSFSKRCHRSRRTSAFS